MANTYLSRTMGSATSRFTFTLSMWVKRSALGEAVFWNSYISNNQRFQLYFDTNDKLAVLNADGGVDNVNLITSRVFRDTNAWYHLYVAVKSSESTAADRVKIYVNGVRETAFDTGTYQSTSNDMALGTSSYTLNIGRYGGNTAFFSGLMSHSYYVDGSIIAVTEFGSTDNTTGEWKINTSPTISSYGNQGHLILKDGNLATDQSANSNNFSIGVGSGGGLSKTEDCPSNVFCTYNPNYRGTRKDLTLTNGNTFIAQQNSGDSSVSATMAISSGKYYWETRIAQVDGTNAAVVGGMHTTEDYNTTPTDVYSENNTCGLRSNGNAHKNGVDLGNFTAATYNNDIFGVGFDGDNGAVYFWRNGTALNSGNAVITGLDMSKTWMPFGIQHGGARVTTSTNWGNGYFQNNPISSAGTNASGNGVFEYNVPSGYTALSTKGLNL